MGCLGQLGKFSKMIHVGITGASIVFGLLVFLTAILFLALTVKVGDKNWDDKHKEFCDLAENPILNPVDEMLPEDDKALVREQIKKHYGAFCKKHKVWTASGAIGALAGLVQMVAAAGLVFIILRTEIHRRRFIWLGVHAGVFLFCFIALILLANGYFVMRGRWSEFCETVSIRRSIDYEDSPQPPQKMKVDGCLEFNRKDFIFVDIINTPPDKSVANQRQSAHDAFGAFLMLDWLFLVAAIVVVAILSFCVKQEPPPPLEDEQGQGDGNEQPEDPAKQIIRPDSEQPE